MEFTPEVPTEDGYYYAHADFAKSSVVVLMRDTIDCMDGTYESVWYAMGNDCPLNPDVLDRIRFGNKLLIPQKSSVTKEVDKATRIYQVITFVMSGVTAIALVCLLAIVLGGGATFQFVSGYTAGIATVFLGLLVLTRWILKRIKRKKGVKHE